MPARGVFRGSDTEISRRRLLQAGAGLAVAAWLPAFRVSTAQAGEGCALPPGFPAGVELYRQGYENWAKAIVVDDLWTCAPRSGEQVAAVANWAHRHGWRVRPRGAMHGWSPLCVTPGTTCETGLLLADTTKHLNSIQVLPGGQTVRAGAGVSMLELASHLEGDGLGFATLTSTGEVTVGGALAVGAHGACAPAADETPISGQTYGSLSNLVVAFKAVVWSDRRRRYELRSFEREHPDSKAFLVNLGRAFIVEATFRVTPNQNLRCVSYTGIPARELFAPPGATGRTFQDFVEGAGRVEAIWFPFTESPWLKVWTVSPRHPIGSRRVDGPYNYPFTDNLPEPLTDLLDKIVSGNTSLTPEYGQAQHAFVSAALKATGADDIWGPSKDLLFYVKATTLRVDELAWAVLTRRRDIQRVVHEVTSFHAASLEELRTRGQFPINAPLQFRVSGLDHPNQVDIGPARPAVLATTSPRRDEPDWDVAIWFNALTFPGTPGEYAYYRKLERWMRSRYRGFAATRPEWSKGWACTDHGMWTDNRMLRRAIPRAISAGRRTDEDWDWARRRLNRYDPHRVFSNRFLDALLPD